MQHRRFLDIAGAGLASALCAFATSNPSAAQIATAQFPERPITLIMPWPAGSSADQVTRAMAEVVGKRFGQPVVVDNRVGGAGTIGPATMAATAKPDGYTISHIPANVFRFPSLQKTSYDPVRDFTYIIQLSGWTLATAVLADGPFKTWADIIAFARANPGKFTYATPGQASQPHLGMEEIAAREGVQLTAVPLARSGEAHAALLGGHVMMTAESTSIRSLVDAGKLRVLNVWGEQRLAIWPDVPTLQELGYPFVFDILYGLAGPKGMNPSIVEKLHDAFKEALGHPNVQAVMAKYDQVPRYLNSADYTASVPTIIARERAVLARLGLLRKD